MVQNAPTLPQTPDQPSIWRIALRNRSVFWGGLMLA